ncbi:MAG TPA: cytochrome c3 family protein, partial [Kofleriaceae bacterium]|nr:cytochrome c3 family protein [Kofleriaceae bacterium]
ETCHRNAAEATTEEVPSPTTATCAAAGCHDGAATFSTTTADCRRCHQAPARQTVGLGSARVRYSHAAHDGRGAPADCVACHGGGGDAPAARDHRPCSDAGCHRDEFASAHPVICGACHVGIEPWRPLHRDPLPPPETEFGAVFSHRRHLGGERPPVTAACASCHAAASAERDMRPPRDHLACTAAGCHAAGGVAPAAGDCAGCHRRDLIAQRRADRLAHRWSVRARFRHRPHRDAACTACHTGLLDSDMLADVPAPAKATCVPCHDGGKAFKLTGHGCARCHGH